ncbi:hypothetical protein PHYBLDRAFT_167910 [Phycomyces blakesleeanus NRRL 1555(-)]|uniref:Uncharacterized protein n=1 Tax=Phycomyces blakesleeanus (strain ATCC 8743b / DSM 1359 / FGSC 10004 / NBRC 33097 / NRRL 1555) TaxID=763407 RepID=A0A162U977_PHYB8|nr:hypothetical protein PHYBLDRAFT_167910 [Phycomyces blakesleeanus NRRL 1555(-)]OAD74502.1 hypothetical protein PHYBLDRAFT_167910 [Phycomyces blakesleeanus NRRL 1555(-)]|eukprot:XP_018292542.1 hypothetical protein PHYBLDRAFT_167910 [Phycomyces blakesleeanus NRRL 1555(-)]
MPKLRLPQNNHYHPIYDELLDIIKCLQAVFASIFKYQDLILFGIKQAMIPRIYDLNTETLEIAGKPSNYPCYSLIFAKANFSAQLVSFIKSEYSNNIFGAGKIFASIRMRMGTI